MNKKFKIAAAAVSVVLAGTMAFGAFGCSSGDDDEGGQPKVDKYNYNNTTITPARWDSTPSTRATGFVDLLKSTYNLTTRVTTNNDAWQTAKGYWEYLKDNKAETASTEGANLTYDKTTEHKDDNGNVTGKGTQINIAIGHNSADTGAFYDTISGSVTLPGGYSASTKKEKPAIAEIEKILGIDFLDMYGGKDHSTSANLGKIKDRNEWNKEDGTGVEIATSDLSKAVELAHNTPGSVLNLANYLDQMPNFKNFLESNPIVYLSLLQAGMSTTDGTGKEIYVAPYFDGNDDIERYCLIRQDWVVDLLDKELTHDGDTYFDACGEKTAALGWMGTTGSYKVETTTADGTDTFDLTKDYAAALAAAKDETKDLGAAYKAIAGEVYAGESGNIVDIMGAAINKNNQAKGKQLATLYRAYIDVAYKNGTSAAYTKRSDLFNGYNAAWDVDDLVAMLRIVKTNAENLGLSKLSTTGIFARDNSNDRTPDIIRLLSQLYGERGADSRYEWTYIDANGQLQDMRNNASFYQALENFGGLIKENLVANYISGAKSDPLKGKCTEEDPGTGFMLYDYSQTQTNHMFGLADDNDYLLGAINTPVSRWDDNSDGTKDTIMRYTESWRSTKTSGLCIAGYLAGDAYAQKRNAVLTFIDYLFSNDGQIVSTYGPQSTNGNTNPNGTWYGNEVQGAVTDGNDIKVDGTAVATKVGGQMVVKEDYKDKYFCYNNKLYTGVSYKGKQTPIVTTELFNSFTSSEGVNKTFGAKNNFTNYARKALGTTLPMGVKDQSFENQLTAPRASAAATKVSVSLANGTIRHPSLIPGTNLWYTAVPTGLPLSDAQSTTLNASAQSNLRYMTGTNKDNKNQYSIFHYIMFYGYNGTYQQNGITIDLGN